MKDRKAKDTLIVIVIALLIVAGVSICWLLVKEKSDEWRESSEGKCFAEKAIRFCSSNRMEFNKVHSPIYCKYCFSCKQRGDSKEYDFTNKEIAECRR